jgi:hypothetical protein
MLKGPGRAGPGEGDGDSVLYRTAPNLRPGSAQVSPDVDPVYVDAEGGVPVPRGGQVLFVGGDAGAADGTSETRRRRATQSGQFCGPGMRVSAIPASVWDLWRRGSSQNVSRWWTGIWDALSPEQAAQNAASFI